MYRDTRLHIVGDARPYASTTGPSKQEKSELLLIQQLYSERKLRQHTQFHEPCGQRLQRFGRFCECLVAVGARFTKHGLSAADKSAEHDDMLRGLSVPATRAGRGGNTWDSAFVEKIGQADLSRPNLSCEGAFCFFQQRVYLQPFFV